MTIPDPSVERTRSGTRRSWRKACLAGLVVAAVVTGLTVFDTAGLLRETLDAVTRLGPWGPVLFVLAYVLATIFFLPGSILTLGAGAAFGVGWGSLYVSLASTLGATAAFLVGRYVARDWVARRVAGKAAFAAIDRAVGRQGWKIVGLTRLSPVFPFNLLNYAFGLTQVSLRDYVAASWIGMMPGTVMYVYLGSLARLGADGATRSPAEWALYGVGLVATVAVTVVITRTARASLRETLGDAASAPDRSESSSVSSKPPPS